MLIKKMFWVRLKTNLAAFKWMEKTLQHRWSCQVSCCSYALTSAALIDLWLFSSCLLPDFFCSSWPFLFSASVFHLCSLYGGVFEAAKLGINRYKYSTEQWKCSLIKCCCLAVPLKLSWPFTLGKTTCLQAVATCRKSCLLPCDVTICTVNMVQKKLRGVAT